MTIEIPSKEKSSTSPKSSNPPQATGGGVDGCCQLLGTTAAFGSLFPPAIPFIIGAYIVGAFCCCGYAAYRRVRKNVYVPKEEEEPPIIGIEYTDIK
jgi:hypothetical protein